MTRSSATRSPGLSETKYSIGPGIDCRRFMSYVIVRASPGIRQSGVCTFQDAHARRLSGSRRRSVCRTTWLREYSKPPRTPRSTSSASPRSRSASSACVAITTASNRSGSRPGVRIETPDASRVTSVTGSAGAHRAGRQGRDEPLHVGLRPALDHPPPGGVAVADEAVVVQEVQQVVHRELEHALGRRGPDRGRDRHEEVLAEASPVPVLVQPLAEGGATAPGGVEQLARVPVEAPDVVQHPPLRGPGERGELGEEAPEAA